MFLFFQSYNSSHWNLYNNKSDNNIEPSTTFIQTMLSLDLLLCNGEAFWTLTEDRLSWGGGEGNQYWPLLV